MTTFVLVRHAQTDSNIAGPNPRMSGWTDFPLNPTGRRQLEYLSRRFAGERGIAALYSSPLTRARQTAERIADVISSSPRLVDDLREINCGRVDGQPIAEVKAQHSVLWEKNLRQEDDDFSWPGGETYRAFRDRCIRALDAIAHEQPSGRVVLVTHAGVITQILGAIHALPPAKWESFRADNTSLTDVRWHRGSGELVSFNDRRHLPPS